MPTYISLVSYTSEGARNMKDSPERLEQAREAMREAGGELKDFYLTLGHYDAVVVGEAPDDATYARVIIRIVGQGAVQVETLKAFTEDEYREIVAAL